MLPFVLHALPSSTRRLRTERLGGRHHGVSSSGRRAPRPGRSRGSDARGTGRARRAPARERRARPLARACRDRAHRERSFGGHREERRERRARARRRACHARAGTSPRARRDRSRGDGASPRAISGRAYASVPRNAPSRGWAFAPGREVEIEDTARVAGVVDRDVRGAQIGVHDGERAASRRRPREARERTERRAHRAFDPRGVERARVRSCGLVEALRERRKGDLRGAQPWPTLVFALTDERRRDATAERGKQLASTRSRVVASGSARSRGERRFSKRQRPRRRPPR